MTYSEYRKELNDLLIEFYNFELERAKDEEFDAEFLECTSDKIITLNKKYHKSNATI